MTSETIKFEAFGETLNITNWAKRSGMSRRTLRDRIAGGMSVEDALTKPVRHAKGMSKVPQIQKRRREQASEERE